MNGFIKITACCVLMSAGCRAINNPTSWNSRDAIKNQTATEELESRIGKTNPAALAALSQSPSQPTTAASIDEHIRNGQSEVVSWYSDKRSDRLIKAKKHFNDALALVPQSTGAHHGLAIIADLEKNYPEAERHYQQALIHKPADSDILGDLGYSYLLQERYSEAEQYCRRAVQANSKNENAMKHLGDACARQGKTDLAQEAYAQVYAAEDIPRVLAENAPTTKMGPAAELANKPNQSLFDRILPKSPGEKLTADIQQRQLRYEEQLQKYSEQNSQQQQQQQSSNYYRQQHLQRDSGRLADESNLSERLLAIDREAAGGNSNGTLLLDDQTGQLTRLPEARGRLQSGTAQNGNYASGQQHFQASQQNGYGTQEFSRNQAQSTNQPASHSPIANSPYFPENQQPVAQQYGSSFPSQEMRPQLSGPQQVMGQQRGLNVEFPAQAEHRFDNSQQQLPPVTNSNIPTQTPWTGIQQAVSESNSHSGSVHQAYQQLPHEMAQPVMQTSNQVQSAMPVQAFQGDTRTQPGYQNQNFPSGTANNFFNPQRDQVAPATNFHSNQSAPGMYPMRSPANAAASFEEASRAAARIGMGLASKDDFVSGNNRAQAINPPGSMSYESTNTPSPQRWMPDAVRSQNLNDVYQPFPNPVRPPSFTQGGQMPPAIYPSYTKEQFGTASRYDTETMQNSNIPRDYNNSMRGYEAQRWEAGREANIAVQEIWNQGPINSPLSPSAGSIYTHPDTGGMMYTPNGPTPSGQGTIPKQWPYLPAGLSNQPPQPHTYQTQNQLEQQPQPGFPQQSAPGSPGGNQNLSTPLGNDQYGNNQYNVGTLPQVDSRNLARSNPATPRNNIVIPSDYRMHTATQSPDYNNSRVTPTGGMETLPLINPASR